MVTVTRRSKIRYSLLALIVSYLRDGTTNTSLFSMLPTVSGAYPFTQNVWTWSLNGQLYQAMTQEITERELPVGVTVAFGADTPEQSHSMPQWIDVNIQIHVRMPTSLVGESYAQQVALKIDQALFRCNGRCEIKDYTTSPPTSTDPVSFLTWVNVARGSWEAVDAKTDLEELRLVFTAKYQQPQEEW
jgi:hypothetical protein